MLKRSPHRYLITSGRATPLDTFAELRAQLTVARDTGIELIQLREKQLTTRDLYALTRIAVELLADSATQVLVNDRADVALASSAAGVHLTTSSLTAAAVRCAFGDELLIGVSCHSLAEARTAREGGADFATFSPIFATPSKAQYGSPVGLEKLREAANSLPGFPLIALGGVTSERIASCLEHGAAGVAGIWMFEHLADRKIGI